MTLPEGFELGVHRAALEAAAKQSGWTIERDGPLIVVRDVWTENEDHRAWPIATKVGLPLEIGHSLGRARDVTQRTGRHACTTAATHLAVTPSQPPAR